MAVAAAIGMGADRADFRVVPHAHALADHRREPAVLVDAEIAAQVGRARAEVMRIDPVQSGPAGRHAGVRRVRLSRLRPVLRLVPDKPSAPIAPVASVPSPSARMALVPAAMRCRHGAAAIPAKPRHRCHRWPRRERARLPRDSGRPPPRAAPASGAGWTGIPRSGCRAGARPPDQSCAAIRDECDASIRQLPSRMTQVRVKRKRPLHGCPSLVPACTLVPVITAVSPCKRTSTSWLPIA